MSIGLAIVHELAVPKGFDPAALIQLCHEAAQELGYDRVRVDEGVSEKGYHYLVGYGCGTVRVRFNRRFPILHFGHDLESQLWEVSRENYRPERCAELVEMLEVRA